MGSKLDEIRTRIRREQEHNQEIQEVGEQKIKEAEEAKSWYPYPIESVDDEDKATVDSSTPSPFEAIDIEDITALMSCGKNIVFKNLFLNSEFLVMLHNRY